VAAALCALTYDAQEAAHNEHDKLATLNRAHPAVTRQQQPDLQLGLPAVELLRKGGPRLQHALITTSAKKLAKVEQLDVAVKQLQKKRSFSTASQLMAALKNDAQLGGWEGPQGCYAALATLWKAHSCLQMHCQRGMRLLVGMVGLRGDEGARAEMVECLCGIERAGDRSGGADLLLQLLRTYATEALEGVGGGSSSSATTTTTTTMRVPAFLEQQDLSLKQLQVLVHLSCITHNRQQHAAAVQKQEQSRLLCGKALLEPTDQERLQDLINQHVGGEEVVAAAAAALFSPDGMAAVMAAKAAAEAAAAASGRKKALPPVQTAEEKEVQQLLLQAWRRPAQEYEALRTLSLEALDLYYQHNHPRK
jgi:hypothetical protein